MSIQQILLRPTDVLFFRDGRPIEGSLAGHGAAWPLPSVTDAALHAALHRAYPVDRTDIDGDKTRTHGDHIHRAVRQGTIRDDLRIRRFGSIVSTGPFPVLVRNGQETWHFPRPRDLDGATLEPTLLPFESSEWQNGSLPKPLQYAVGNRKAPTKDSSAKAWLTRQSIEEYLRGSTTAQQGVNDAEFFDAEHAVGIAIDPETQTTGQGAAEGKIYSAHYLRLRDDWRLGQLAGARNGELPLLEKMLRSDNGQPAIVVGGQQRLCTAESSAISTPPLPTGLTTGFHEAGNGKHLVKWVLLSPAIWPATEDGNAQRRASTTTRQSHPGGWLPNWIDPRDGSVLLRSVTKEQRRVRRHLNSAGKGYATDEGGAQPIPAKLVAALVPKPIPVTGWSLGELLADDADARQAGAKSTHLAVPAGAVYYFEADSAEAAAQLAAALNWHGTETNPTKIVNRRSTLMGEKGFGLGVCGTWEFFPAPGDAGGSDGSQK